jgi:hypothetical protein
MTAAPAAFCSISNTAASARWVRVRTYERANRWEAWDRVRSATGARFFFQKATMKIIVAFVFAVSIAVAGAVHAQQSLPDSNPECMRVNGPDCVLKSATVPNRTVPPPGLITTPLPTPPVIIAPAAPIEPARPISGARPGEAARSSAGEAPRAVPGAATPAARK